MFVDLFMSLVTNVNSFFLNKLYTPTVVAGGLSLISPVLPAAVCWFLSEGTLTSTAYDNINKKEVNITNHWLSDNTRKNLKSIGILSTMALLPISIPLAVTGATASVALLFTFGFVHLLSLTLAAAIDLTKSSVESMLGVGNTV